MHGFTQTRCNALLRYWDAVCRHGPCGPICSLHIPGMSVFLLTCKASITGFFDSLDVLNDFTRQVVVSRREAGVRKCWCAKVDQLASGGFGFQALCLASAGLCSSVPQSQVCRILVVGHPVIIVDQSWILWVIFYLRNLILTGIMGRDLQEFAVCWMVGLGMRLRLFRFLGFRLAILLELVETTGVWPQGLLDAYIAIIPKADGDSTPLGQRPLRVLLVVYRQPLLGLVISGSGLKGLLPKSVFSLGNGLSSVEAWFSTALDIEEVLSGVGGDQLHVMVADVIKSFDTVGRSILDCTLGRLGFRKAYFAYHSKGSS